MTTLQTTRAVDFEPAPVLEGIEWATPSVAAPADPRLDPAPTLAESSGRRLSPIASVGGLRRSMGARRARRLASRPQLESVFPDGHPGFELPSTSGERRLALVAPAPAPAAAAPDEAALLAFDFAS